MPLVLSFCPKSSSNVTEPGDDLSVPNHDLLGFDFWESHIVLLVPQPTDRLRSLSLNMQLKWGPCTEGVGRGKNGAMRIVGLKKGTALFLQVTV